ncbi:hypothetical protein FH972_021327 [Carpinus fangiana]|uniref:Uncharacterized protein n=1 Tax=Carpinus fangiana TaxID=176857 RepID=A0A5N6KPD8_9ROSI|nr:hypothetical protein FH972_021327 [Carpinus fangiana]
MACSEAMFLGTGDIRTFLRVAGLHWHSKAVEHEHEFGEVKPIEYARARASSLVTAARANPDGVRQGEFAAVSATEDQSLRRCDDGFCPETALNDALLSRRHPRVGGKHHGMVVLEVKAMIFSHACQVLSGKWPLVKPSIAPLASEPGKLLLQARLG